MIEFVCDCGAWLPLSAEKNGPIHGTVLKHKAIDYLSGGLAYLRFPGSSFVMS